MKKYRATIDQHVIEAWATKTARFNRSYGRAQVILFIALLAVAASLFYAPSAFLTILVFLFGFALVALQLHTKSILLCPNCNKPPDGYFAHGTAEDADMCVHCYYWLRQPWSENKDGA